MTGTNTNKLLGYPVDARLLIINADDFGMCHSVNEAIINGLLLGVIPSTTLMVPCPWALRAMHFLKEHPEFPFGVHLTAISEWASYRWRPLTPIEKGRSLVDENGFFYNFEQMPKFLAQVNLDQLEIEFRAQIEVVLMAGLKPTHLDWHCLRLDSWPDVSELIFRLAREYGLAARVTGRSWIKTVQGKGFPCNDYNLLDSYLLDPVNKTAHLAELLRRLPAGLNEWAVHPGLDSSELLAIEPHGNHIRQTDFDFLTSQQLEVVLKEEGIILLDYRPLQAIWRDLTGQNGIPA